MPGTIVQDYLSSCKLILRKKDASMNFRGDEMLNLISVLWMGPSQGERAIIGGPEYLI